VNPRKVYAVDPGLAVAMYHAGAKNQGAQLENAVTWVKTPSGKEVDFAIDDPVRGGPPELVQVCAHLDAPATRQRELEALVEAMTELGFRSATIVTMTDDEQVETSAGPIRVMPAREWFFRRGPGQVEEE